MVGCRRLWWTVVVWGVAFAASAAAPGLASAANLLGAGGTLGAGQSIVSPNGEYELVMQSDGNLVESISGGRSLWSTQTADNAGAHAVMQTNGNLAVIDSAGATLWSSNSHASGCASELAVQDDGNIVIYDPQDQPVWSAGTVVSGLVDGDVLRPGWSRYSPAENTELIMQSDGNLVLYAPTGALWGTGTEGHPGAWAVLQSDGNLVVYSAADTALWDTATNSPGDLAWVQPDGNFALYTAGDASVLWAAGTGGRTIPGSVAPAPPAAGSCPSPPAPVVTAPVTTTLPQPSSPRALGVRVAISWTWNRATTRLRSVKIGSFPGSTELLLSCRGRGCPRHSKVSAHGHRGLHRLLRSLPGHRYRAGDRLFITLRALGYDAERAEIEFRWGAKPRVTLL
jgi:hypothetical protein